MQPAERGRILLHVVLVELNIRDLALIEAGDLSLGPGLNAITGETGAGKSLLVAALELVRGETPRGGAAQWVRKDADEARVEARFEVEEAGCIVRLREVIAAELPALAEELFDTDEGACEVILGRTLTRAGRTKAYVNQRPIPKRALARLAQALIEIHGQNDRQELLDPHVQLRLLDAFGGSMELFGAYTTEREHWVELRARKASLEGEHSARVERVDLLRFQREELRTLGPVEGEHTALAEERELLRSATDLGNELGGTVNALESSEDALIDRLHELLRTVERWCERLPKLETTREDLTQATIHLEEAAGTLRSLVEAVEADPARLEHVEGRMAEYDRLARKYRIEPDGLGARQELIEGELHDLEHTDQTLAQVEEEVARSTQRLEAAAKALSKKRRAPVEKLVQAVHESLARLGLEHARFSVVFEERVGEERYAPQGIDRIAFHRAANPGEGPAPLSRVASGGEAARIMLALRTVLSVGDRGRTLVFDEIDAGVGGRLGPEVGRHLRDLGSLHQVMCVTHLPAIAACADLHLHTFKEIQEGRTRTTIEPLEGEARIREIADMIAGGADQATARAEAQRLLNSRAESADTKKPAPGKTPAQESARKRARAERSSRRS